jgi:hypothetical protein
MHCEISFSIFPSPARMSLTKVSPIETLVSDIQAVDGNIEKLFLWCIYLFTLGRGGEGELNQR